jgi:hypothetical protein
VNIFNHNPKSGNPYYDSDGNIQWDTIATALASAPSNAYFFVDRIAPIPVQKILGKTPSVKTFVAMNGTEVDGSDTPSHTRSRTLLDFMAPIPHRESEELFMFGKAVVKKYGPAWSCLSRSAKHRKTIQVIPWDKHLCPLYKDGRYTGKSILHNFTLGADGIHCHDYSWEGICEQQSTNPKDESS